MREEQKVSLQPLSADDAMILLWRQVRVKEAKDVDDESVMFKLNDMKENKASEYSALKEICGYDSAYSLGGLPLAIVQAGTYIGRFQCSFVDYVKLLKETTEKAELDRIFREAQRLSHVNDAQKSILTTWKINVDCLPDEAYGVLRSMSMLGPGPIPEIIVTGIMKRVANEGECTKRMIRDLLMEELVHSSSLVYRKKSVGGDTFEIHRVVRRFVLAGMERGSAVWKKSYGNAFISLRTRIEEMAVIDGFSLDCLPDVFGDQYRLYLPHSFAIVDNYVLPRSTAHEVIHITKLYELAKFTDKSSKFLGGYNAVNMWRSVLATLELYHRTNRNHPHIAGAMNFLGNLYQSQGKLDAAESMYSESLTMYRVIHGESANHPNIAMILNNFGILYVSQGKLEAAESMYSGCLKMRRVIYGENANHPDIAMILNNFGLLYASQGKLDAAESMYSECLTMYRVIHGENTNHPDIAMILNNFGILYKSQGKLDAAESMYSESLTMRRVIYGENTNHPSIASTLNNFGLLYKSQGKLDATESMHERASRY